MLFQLVGRLLRRQSEGRCTYPCAHDTGVEGAGEKRTTATAPVATEAVVAAEAEEAAEVAASRKRSTLRNRPAPTSAEQPAPTRAEEREVGMARVPPRKRLRFGGEEHEDYGTSSKRDKVSTRKNEGAMVVAKTF